MMMDAVMFEEKYALPEGDYVVVAWDLVATGLSLFDDICQIAAYAPGAKAFSQHIMPYHNMSVGSRRRHHMNVISAGRYRILKDVRSNKTLHTKTDYLAVIDFMDWLKEVKGTSDGIILVAHDPRKLNSSVLMEVLSKYNLRGQFCSLVKGFANCYMIAESKLDKAVRSYSIRSLCTEFLNSDDELGEATERAQAIYNVLEHMFEAEAGVSEKGDADDKSPRKLAHDIHAFCCNTDGVNKITADLKSLQEREESLQPLFGSMRNNRADRQRSFNLQRLLARSNIDYDILSDIYKKGGLDAINEVLKCTMAQEHAREMEELKHVFAMHFDPEYKGEWKPEKPAGDRPPRTYRRNSRSKKSRNQSGKNRASSESEAKDVSDGKTPTDSPTGDGKMPAATTTKNDSDGKEPLTLTCSPMSEVAASLPALTITNDENQTETVVAAVV